jgi:hypothetical protein
MRSSWEKKLQKFAVNKLAKRLFKSIKKNRVEYCLALFSLIFSSWLMFTTFSYRDGSMFIANKAWSDFANHIPLVRSFSFGSNFPPEYPLFPGLPIRYHFLFYLISGLLEKIGLQIDYALNVPSIIGFFGLIMMIYFFAKLLFKSRVVGILSVVFFLFNGSLSFIYFLKNHPLLSSNFLSDVIANKDFSSFAPYYGTGIVSAFWNLNIYTNQRHLAFSYALSLLLIYVLVKKISQKKKIPMKLTVVLGFVLGISFFLNMAVFAMTILIIFMLLILFSKNRVALLTLLSCAMLIALPFYLYSRPGSPISTFSFFKGYLINNNLTLYSFFHYWFYNLGLHLILMPFGFFIASKGTRKIFIAFFSLFVIANLVRFSPEIAANHKFINYFMIVGAMFSSYFLVWLWRKKNILKPVVLLFLFFLTFSGIVDFFPIYNDTKIALADYPSNPDVKWIKENTAGNTVFFNSDYLYTPASLAGRKIFLGWPYFSWSQGYDTYGRGTIRNLILTISNKKAACGLLRQNKIDYIEISPIVPNADNPSISNMYLENFTFVYRDHISGYGLLSVKESCQK